MQDCLHFEVDGLVYSSNLHPIRGLGAFFFIRALYSARGTKNDRKQRPQAPKGDVKICMQEFPHFEVDSLGDGCNLHPFRGLGSF